jgi:hypothetical protein
MKNMQYKIPGTCSGNLGTYPGKSVGLSYTVISCLFRITEMNAQF